MTFICHFIFNAVISSDCSFTASSLPAGLVLIKEKKELMNCKTALVTEKHTSMSLY